MSQIDLGLSEPANDGWNGDVVDVTNLQPVTGGFDLEGIG